MTSFYIANLLNISHIIDIVDHIPKLTQFDWVAMFTSTPEEFATKIRPWIGIRNPTQIAVELLDPHIKCEKNKNGGGWGKKHDKKNDKKNGKNGDVGGHCETEEMKRIQDLDLVSLSVVDVFDTMYDVVNAMNILGEEEATHGNRAKTVN